MIDPAAAAIAIKAVAMAAAAFIFGTSTVLALYWNALAAELGKRLAPRLKLSAVVLLAATVAMLPALTAAAGDGWADALSPVTLWDFASATRSGEVQLLRIVLAAFVIHALQTSVWTADRMSRRVAFASMLYIATYALTGHTLLHTGFMRLGHQLNHTLHVLAGSFWIGALPALLSAALLLTTPRRTQALQLLNRFASAGTVAVMLVAVTGAMNTYLILGQFPDDISSTYQMLLLAKIVTVALMIVLAAVNRFWLVPHAKRHATDHLLMASVAAECVAGALVVVLVAVFGALEPL